jgi:Glutathione synthase/Ribosomal protein S6 modification enzyme (glutaminyl transferase)
VKKILLLHSKKNNGKSPVFEAYAEKLNGELKGDGIEVYSAALDGLVFDASSFDAKIYDAELGINIKDFDLVVQRVVTGLTAEAHAISVYCKKNGIKYIDSYLNRITNDKMSAAFMYWEAGLSIPRTIAGPVEELVKKLEELGNKAVLKDAFGAKGKHNYVVRSADDIRKIHSDNPDIKFVLQEFIPNDGDYRVLVFDYEPVMVIKRTAVEGTHLNNTSMGGTAEKIDLEEVSNELLNMAVEASRREGLEVSGVDLIIDKDSGKAYVLEVNQAPQVSSGSFIEEKTVLYVDMLRKMVNGGEK